MQSLCILDHVHPLQLLLQEYEDDALLLPQTPRERQRREKEKLDRVNFLLTWTFSLADAISSASPYSLI